MRKWRILVCDDEPDVGTVIHAALKARYEVVTARAPRKVVEWIDTIEPDFIILDLLMPDMDGHEVCRRIRANSRFRKTPILFLSASNSRQHQKDAYGAGANLYLTKPFDPIRLEKNIDVFLERTPPAFINKRFAYDDLEGLIAELNNPAPTETPRPQAADRKETPPPQASTATAPRPAPSQSTPPPRARKKAPPGKASQGTPRALFVLEDSDELCALAEACEGRYEFTWSRDGLTALQRLHDFEPDIVVVEAAVPHMDGFELVRAIRADGTFARTPVVFYAARAGATERAFAQKCGANAYLKRPADPAEVVSLLDRQMAAAPVPVRPKNRTIDQVLDMIEMADTVAAGDQV